ncbi:MAG: hypothetical protein ABJK28_07260 [Algibacter sp.]
MIILELIGDLLSFFTDLQFNKDRKKRRAFEKENNLPKKLMINPNHIALASFITLVVLFCFGYTFYQHIYSNKKNTIKELTKIDTILIETKTTLGSYPEKLTDIIRNNPLRKNIHLDLWGNAYHYKLTKVKPIIYYYQKD